MKQNILIRSLLVLGFAIALQAQTAPAKVGIINIQQAIISTKDGQAAVKELQEKFNPKQKQLQDSQAEIQQLQQQLQRGANTLSQEALAKLRQDIDDKQRNLQRAGEDAQLEFNQAQQSTFAGISEKMQAVIDKFYNNEFADKAQYAIAFTYETYRRDYTNARQNYEKILQLYPNSSLQTQVREALLRIEGK